MEKSGQAEHVLGGCPPRLLLLLAMAAGVEAALAVAAWQQRIGAVEAILLHMAFAGLLAALLLRRAGRAWVAALISAAAILVAGPLGALGMLALAVVGGFGASTGRTRSGRASTTAGRPADLASRLCEDIASDRMSRLDSRGCVRFGDVMRTGDMAARQALLGLIGRKYHPAYLPTLRQALASPDAIVRVQAAAVFVRLRERIAAQFQDALRRLAAGDRAGLHDLEACLASGLLEPAEQVRARAEIQRAEALPHPRMSRTASGFLHAQ